MLHHLLRIRLGNYEDDLPHPSSILAKNTKTTDITTILGNLTIFSSNMVVKSDIPLLILILFLKLAHMTDYDSTKKC